LYEENISMTTWHEYIQQNETVPAWSYPIRYEEEHFTSADVLVLGGGIAGCHAAINARRRGQRSSPGKGHAGDVALKLTGLPLENT
jgi:hypothetical protein